MAIFLKSLLETTFYRGENDSGLKIEKDPFQHAKDVGGIFVSKSERHAKLYGDKIFIFNSKPNAKILSFEKMDFWRLIGRRMPPNKWLGSVVKQEEHLIDLFNIIIDKSKQLGYDAVIFSNTDDIGTVILNQNAFEVVKL